MEQKQTVSLASLFEAERERDELRAEVLRLQGLLDAEQQASHDWRVEANAEIERLRLEVEWWKTRAETYESLANRLTEQRSD